MRRLVDAAASWLYVRLDRYLEGRGRPLDRRPMPGMVMRLRGPVDIDVLQNLYSSVRFRPAPLGTTSTCASGSCPPRDASRGKSRGPG